MLVWANGLQARVREIYRTVNSAPQHGTFEPTAWGRFDFLTPAMPCDGLQRVGSEKGSDDNGQVVCAFNIIQTLPSCIVYSFGGGDSFAFDVEFAMRTNCSIFTFDCGVHDFASIDTNVAALVPPRLRAGVRARIHPYSICVGPANAGLPGKGTFMTYDTIVEMLGHRGERVDFLRLNVGGLESEVLPGIMADATAPDQIGFALHYLTELAQSWPLRTRPTAELALEALGVYHANGFALAHREDDYLCEQCTKLVMHHLLC
eukprot:TRINITY_DN10923_c0_g1_i2.p1 TRINITY_DN10923_c0_g1~~TRINITY_DN10923_c0_g1_i2.p1  ORF type:complete len:261 (-),score=45.90 TRINITY_DN10923_c0_g1_i2:7-789(-)